MNMYSGHFGFSSDKDDRLIAILLDHFRRLKSVRVIYPNFSKKYFVLADVPGYSLKGVYYHAQLEERVSLVDKTKVDSLLLIPQSPLAVEDLRGSVPKSGPIDFASKNHFPLNSADHMGLVPK